MNSVSHPGLPLILGEPLASALQSIIFVDEEKRMLSHTPILDTQDQRDCADLC